MMAKYVKDALFLILLTHISLVRCRFPLIIMEKKLDKIFFFFFLVFFFHAFSLTPFPDPHCFSMKIISERKSLIAKCR